VLTIAAEEQWAIEIDPVGIAGQKASRGDA